MKLQLDEEQQRLWTRVDELWRMSLTGDPASIRHALHPDYTGWVTGEASVHDREYGVDSVDPSSSPITEYKLYPMAVTVFDNLVGIAHYRYQATLQESETRTLAAAGRWTEVYLKKNDEWIMLSISGGPDGER